MRESPKVILGSIFNGCFMILNDRNSLACLALQQVYFKKNNLSFELHIFYEVRIQMDFRRLRIILNALGILGKRVFFISKFGSECRKTKISVIVIVFLKVLFPVQIFLSHAVVLLSLISRFALVREQIDSITTGSQKEIGRVPLVFICQFPISCYALLFLLPTFHSYIAS